MNYKGTNEVLTDNGIGVQVANGASIKAKAMDILGLPLLPAPARACHKFAPDDLTYPYSQSGKQ